MVDLGGASMRETDVTYKARANFSDLLAKIAEARAAIAELRAAEKKANAESIAENKQVAAAHRGVSSAIKARAAAQKALNDEEAKAAGLARRSIGDLEKVDQATQKVGRTRRTLKKDTEDLTKAEGDLAAARFRASSAGETTDTNRLALEKKIFGAVEATRGAIERRRSTEIDTIRSVDAERRKSDAGQEVTLRRRVVYYTVITAAQRALGAAARDGQRAITDGFHAVSTGSAVAVRDVTRLKNATEDVGRETGRVRAFFDKLFAGIGKGIGGAIRGLSGLFSKLDGIKLWGTGGGGMGGAIAYLLWSLPALLPILASVLNIVGPAIAGIGALGAGTMAFAANLSSLAAGLVAIVPLMAGFAAIAVTAKTAFSGVGTAITAQDKLATLKSTPGTTPAQMKSAQTAATQAMQGLAPAAQTFVKWVGQIGDAWDKIQQKVQQNFFSGFVKDLNKVNGLLPSVGKLLEGVATSLGKVGDMLIKNLSSPQWKDFLSTLGKDLDPLIGQIGKTLMSVLDLFRNLTVAALPFTVKLVTGINNVVRHLATMLDTPAKAAAFGAFLETVYKRLLVWLDILKNIGLFFGRMSSAASGWSDSIVNNFDKLTQKWAAFAKLQEQTGSPFKKYLEEIKPLLAAFGQLGNQFFTAFVKSMTDPTNIKNMTDAVHALGQLGSAIAALYGTLTKGGQVANVIKVITDAIKLINDLLKNGGLQVLQDAWKWLDFLLKALDQFANIPGVGTAIGILVTGLSALAVLKFVGLFKLFGAIAAFAGNARVLSLLARIPLVGKLMDWTGTTIRDPKSPVVQTKGGVPQYWEQKPSKSDPLYDLNKNAKVGDPIMEPGYINGAGMNARNAARLRAQSDAYNTGAYDAMFGKGSSTSFGGEKIGKFTRTFKTGAYGQGFRAAASAAEDATVGARLGGATLGLGATAQLGGGRLAALAGRGMFGRVLSGLGGLASGVAASSFGSSPDIVDPKYMGYSKQQKLNLATADSSKPMLNLFGLNHNPFSYGTTAKGADAQLAKMVKTGDITGATAAWKTLVQNAAKYGLTEKDLAASYPKLGAALNLVTGGVKKQTDAVHGGALAWKDWTDTAANAAVSGKDADTAIKDLVNSFKHQAAASKDGKVSLDFNTAAGRANRQAFAGAMVAIKAHGDAMKANGSTTAEVSAYTLSHVRTLQQQAIKAGASKKDVANLTAALLKVPHSIVSKIDVQTSAAYAALSKLHGMLYSIQDRNITVATHFTQTGQNLASGGARYGSPSAGGFVPKYYAAGDIVMNDGPMRPKGTDVVPAMLTPGEFVLRKGIVDKIGVENLRALNSGLKGYGQFMSSLSGVQRPLAAVKSGALPAGARDSLASAAASTTSNTAHITIHNPVPERATDTLPRTVRKLGYIFPTR